MSNKTNNKRFLVTYADQEISKAAAVKLLKVDQSNVKEGVSFMSADREALKDNVLHFDNLGISLLELTSENAKKLATQKGILAVEEDAKVYALDIEIEGVEPDYQPEVYINQEEMAKFKAADKSKGGAKVKSKLHQKEDFDKTIETSKFQKEDMVVGDKVVPEEETMPFNSKKNVGKNNLVVDRPWAAEKQIQSQEGGFAGGYKKAMVDIFSSVLDANLKKDVSESCDVAPDSAGALNTVANVNPSYVPWNIRMVKAPGAWARGYDGTEVKVAVLDTGIDYNHPDLYVYGGADFTGSGSYMDYNGHGSHCAGIIAAREYRGQTVGVAPRAKLYAVKVLDNDGSGYTSNIIAGMEWCANNDIRVASMSLGGCYAPTIAYGKAVSRCQRNGVLVVASAGNSGNYKYFPWVCAPANSVSTQENDWSGSPIAVGAVDSNNNLAYFSSRGQETYPWNRVGCVAPGVSVRSTYLNNGYAYMDGTSMACPHVAGLAALLCQQWPWASVYCIKKQLLYATYWSHGDNSCEERGFGLINCERVVSNIEVMRGTWYSYYLLV
ncbi:bacteriocin [Prevotella intermedia]|uniref:S8 family peptidase n=1 Tax=Prevotella intermedia TaxID=28131 RepID=UPI000C1C3A37|nr:S8 family peptidase [Prevotella intermedia]ATV29862.1 bacteriocin [Prevotella intermedia]